MGEVWRARDSRLPREGAIKVLPSDVAADKERLKRFRTEARSGSSLNHPNIVTIYDIGEADSTSYIVMELVEGKTLRELLAGGPLPVKKILTLSPQIVEGLARAHEAGIVHRDLKPENVMVTKDGLVKILDFGLAKLTQPEPDSAKSRLATVTRGTEAGTVMGTVGYMSPEQASGGAVDYRSDQFSLGAILYEMATGRRAFQRESKPEILTAIIREEPEPIGSIAPRTPAPFRWIVERCLAKEPERRYASTEDLARELADLKDHLSELSSQSLSLPVAGAGAARRRFALPAAAIAGAVALLAAGALGGWWLTSRGVKTEVPSFHRLTFRRGNLCPASTRFEG